jgi:hypothetical protein
VPDTAENTPIVEISEQLDDRRVYIGKAIEHTVTQPSEKPAPDDANRRLDFPLVTRSARLCRQNGTAVVSRHSGVGPIDLRIKKAGLDDRDLGVVRDKQCRRPAKSLERQQVAFDPIWKRFAPAGMSLPRLSR